jgi:hypothetical protein
MEPWRIRRMAVLPIYAVEILKNSNGPRLR